MELVAGMAGYCYGPRLVGMFELAMTAALPRERPAIVVQQPQEVANFHDVRLAYGVLGEAWLATVGGLAEEEAGGAVLGVGFELVRDVRRRCAGDVMTMQLDGAGAVGAAKLGVVVNEGFGDGFKLPERLVSTACLEASTLDLALVDFF